MVWPKAIRAARGCSSTGARHGMARIMTSSFTPLCRSFGESPMFTCQLPTSTHNESLVDETLDHPHRRLGLGLHIGLGAR